MSNNGGGGGENQISAFKRVQLRHRRHGANPNRTDDMDALLDFSSPNHAEGVVPVKSEKKLVYQGPLYGLEDFPGFLYAPQALSPSLQQDLAYLAVSEYCEAPHATNIDLVPPKPNEDDAGNQSMWEHWKQQHVFSSSSASRVIGGRRPYKSFSKLSWSTCGYQYDWTARAYSESKRTPMPELLEIVSSIFARTALTLDCADSIEFTPSACIVNYYTTKSIMGGHRDDLELAFDKPVVSLSLGLPAIFVLGGKTKEDAPVLSILVRPGDVMMLGGDCRLNYHGMSRVLPAAVSLSAIPKQSQAPASFQVSRQSIQSWKRQLHDGAHAEADLQDEIVPEVDRISLFEYLEHHRININVRQVLPDGMDTLPATDNHES